MTELEQLTQALTPDAVKTRARKKARPSRRWLWITAQEYAEATIELVTELSGVSEAPPELIYDVSKTRFERYKLICETHRWASDYRIRLLVLWGAVYAALGSAFVWIWHERLALLAVAPWSRLRLHGYSIRLISAIGRLLVRRRRWAERSRSSSASRWPSSTSWVS